MQAGSCNYQGDARPATLIRSIGFFWLELSADAAEQSDEPHRLRPSVINNRSFMH